MAKNFGKILLGLTAAGAAGAGAYYWLKNRHNEEPEDEFDDSFLQIIIFCIKQNPEENLFFLPGLLLPFRYFGSLNELFSETILLNTRCSLDES